MSLRMHHFIHSLSVGEGDICQECGAREDHVVCGLVRGTCPGEPTVLANRLGHLEENMRLLERYVIAMTPIVEKYFNISPSERGS
jgi:hypothetical protein